MAGFNFSEFGPDYYAVNYLSSLYWLTNKKVFTV